MQANIKRNDNIVHLNPKKSKEAGSMKNQTHKRSPLPDPVIALAKEEKKARDKFNNFSKGGTLADEQTPEYRKVENSYHEAFNKFMNTPACSLEGLLLQAQYILNEQDDPEAEVLVKGIKNIIGHSTPPKPVDAVVNYMQESMKLYKEETTIEGKRYSKEEPYSIYYDAYASELYAKSEALEQLASTTHAESIEGCLVHTALLQHQINLLEGFEHDETDIKNFAMAGTRLLFSIKGVLARYSAIDEAELGMVKYMTENMNPWLSADERIALVEEKCPRVSEKAA